MARKGPSTDGPLQTALLESTSAATTRASKGQKIFSPIAVFLDKHCSQTTGLAPHLLRALTTLSDNLASVAQQHFNAYISVKSTPTTHPKASIKKPMPLVKQPLPDIWLFVCLPANHAARKMEAYAIYSSLQSQLNLNSVALKEVQAIKTGFALCLSSPEALLALEAQKETISAFFVNC
ncbi:hypothetical protein TSTA_107380 [Talaromyces stipitatus ATCC 10500]|uniref:Uncharacterized protein n=1 Tax=Talaromyces stipitatus (strain ATCC 10500 / CBS 375.48 / QM 6759 / NRRL 1006) TaxID=441959 RepID=B8MN82_TALSN|nr:uncharacterized protein TSTA_107380 [Talaromyces stipitatus ATCC 10500]EED14531.1 hypothetical protein TSTA_107380 [Talaromyces stipitatus ATCC 10500]